MKNNLLQNIMYLIKNNKDELTEIANKNNINIFLFALVLCSPMISFIINVENIIPAIIITSLIFLIILNREVILKKEKMNVCLIAFIAIFIFIVLLQILIGKWNIYFEERDRILKNKERTTKILNRYNAIKNNVNYYYEEIKKIEQEVNNKLANIDTIKIEKFSLEDNE